MTENRIKVYISDNYFKAYVSVNFREGEIIEPEDILEAFKAKNVVYGIDMDVVAAICKLNEDVYDELVAEGQPHIHGINSEIIYTFSETPNAKPKLKEDGTVNFKILNLLQKVKAGDLLATKIPAVEGIDGMTVTGKCIHAKNAKDVKFSLGENVEISEDGLELLAACDGIYKIDNNKVSVCRYLEFNKGVGINTGNVLFDGDVVVIGNISDGFTIECDGNLSVDGLVEGAILKVSGDIAITKGVTGHKQSVITCGGNLFTGFIDNATVTVKGNLEAGEILNCIVYCDGEVIVKGKKGHIIGGEITAKYAINATTIGSRLGVITLINLGVDIESVQELKQLKIEIEDDYSIAKKLKTIVTILKIKELKGIITGVESKTLKQCYENLEQTNYRIKEKTIRYKELQDILIKAKSGQIKTETIYPDTLVKIGESSYFIDEAKLRSIIKKSGDEVIAIGF